MAGRGVEAFGKRIEQPFARGVAISGQIFSLEGGDHQRQLEGDLLARALLLPVSELCVHATPLMILEQPIAAGEEVEYPYGHRTTYRPDIVDDPDHALDRH